MSRDCCPPSMTLSVQISFCTWSACSSPICHQSSTVAVISEFLSLTTHRRMHNETKPLSQRWSLPGFVAKTPSTVTQWATVITYARLANSAKDMKWIHIHILQRDNSPFEQITYLIHKISYLIFSHSYRLTYSAYVRKVVQGLYFVVFYWVWVPHLPI